MQKQLVSLARTFGVFSSSVSIRTAEARVMLPVGWQCFNASDEVYAWSDGDVQFNLDDV